MFYKKINFDPSGGLLRKKLDFQSGPLTVMVDSYCESTKKELLLKTLNRPIAITNGSQKYEKRLRMDEFFLFKSNNIQWWTASKV